MKTKVCTGCKKRKSLASFGKNKSREDGLYLRCRKCANAATMQRKVVEDRVMNDLEKFFILGG
jgi:hypothetical protein